MAYTYQQAISWLQEHNFPHLDYLGRFVEPETNTPKHIFRIDTMALPEDFHSKAKVTQEQQMDSLGEVVMYRLEYRKGGRLGRVVDPAHINFVAAHEDAPMAMDLSDDEDMAPGAQMSGQGATTVLQHEGIQVEEHERRTIDESTGGG